MVFKTVVMRICLRCDCYGLKGEKAEGVNGREVHATRGGGARDAAE